MAYIPTEKELRQILATILAGATGKAETHWKAKLGTLRQVPPTTDPCSNWKLIDVGGSPNDQQAIETAAFLVRGEHPYVNW